MNNNYPNWPLKIIRKICKTRYVEQIEGDTIEIYERSERKKLDKLKFIVNTLGFVRLRYLREIEDVQQLTSIAMVKNYLKISIRTLLRHKTNAAINILGLSIALASSLLIMKYVIYENSYDKSMPDAERIHRITNGTKGSSTPSMLATTIAQEIPGIEAATKVNGLGEALLTTDDKNILQDGGAWVDLQFFDVFHANFIEGSKESALSLKESVVLTKEIAEKFFPGESAMGKMIKIDNDNFKVTAVVENTPKNTIIPYKYLVANPLDPNRQYYWTGNQTYTFARFRPESMIEQVNLQLRQLYENYVASEYLDYTGFETLEELQQEYPDRSFTFTAYPILGLHLKIPHLSLGNRGDEDRLLIFSMIAFFILLIAGINYVNMAVAQSTTRSKEVGIRKALGSHKRGLLAQFLTESLLISIIATLLGLLIAVVALDTFSSIVNRNFEVSELLKPGLLGLLVGVALIVGILAGLYPATIISRFDTVRALRGSINQPGKLSLRNGLVAFQFATSIFLIAATLVIYVQVQHMRSQELGINIDQKLVIDNGMELGSQFDVFEQMLASMPFVLSVAKASHAPFLGLPNYTYQVYENASKTVQPMNAFFEPGIEKVLDLELVQGRWLEEKMSDTSKVVINEALAQELDWKEPLGKRLNRDELVFEIVGVVKNFNFESLRRQIRPLIIRHGSDNYEVGEYHQRYVLVRLQGQNVQQMVAQINDAWDQLVPAYPFQSEFMDQSFDRLYNDEQRFIKTFTIFSGLSLIIALLGLFTLTSFVLKKRYKEIAIRKVMGASHLSVVRLIVQDFSLLVVIGGVIGLSVAFYYLSDWLNNYTYRIELSWYLLIVPLVIVLFITGLIVSLKSYRVALSNPANALKEE